MNINIRLYGTLRDKLPKEQKGKGILTLEAMATIADALRQLDIVPGEVLVALNEEHESREDSVLAEGDTLTVFTHVAGGLQ